MYLKILSAISEARLLYHKSKLFVPLVLNQSVVGVVIGIPSAAVANEYVFWPTSKVNNFCTLSWTKFGV